MYNWFRGVVWPRGEISTTQNKGRKLYRYAIVGVLITDYPLSNLDGNEFLVDGQAFNLGGEINSLPQKEPTIKIGDANMVLTSLDTLVN